MADQFETRPDYVPHFEVTTLGGQRVRYRDIWQRRNLILVLAAPHDRNAAAQYESHLLARRQEFEEANTAVIVTIDVVPPLPGPQVLVADQWGEILYTSSGGISSYPGADELLSWVHFVRMQCPECPP